MSEALVFVGVCVSCGGLTEPCLVEGLGETWKSGEQWTFLALEQHKTVCRGPGDVDEAGHVQVQAQDATGRFYQNSVSA